MSSNFTFQHLSAVFNSCQTPRPNRGTRLRFFFVIRANLTVFCDCTPSKQDSFSQLSRSHEARACARNVPKRHLLGCYQLFFYGICSSACFGTNSPLDLFQQVLQQSGNTLKIAPLHTLPPSHLASQFPPPATTDTVKSAPATEQTLIHLLQRYKKIPITHKIPHKIPIRGLRPQAASLCYPPNLCNY